ncbi:hypothetical protein T484DRAFT_1799483, partial [Baffinella frigidus]
MQRQDILGILPFLPPVGPSEGSSSSGLEGSPWVGGDSAAPPCFALIIRYPCKNFSPSYSVGSFVWHLFNLCSQVYNTMEVVFVDERISELKASDQVYNTMEVVFVDERILELKASDQ